MKLRNIAGCLVTALVIGLLSPAGNVYGDETKEERWIFGDYVFGDGQMGDTPGRMYIVGYKGNDSKITIPGEIDGKTIEFIDGEAFLGLSCLENVILPEEILCIFEEGFKDCTNLKSITMPKVRDIDVRAFSDCVNLERIVLPDSLETIGELAFENCCKLESITLPKNVWGIGKQAFLGCENLKEIKVSSENTKFAAVDGILYNKDLTKMIFCPQAKTGKITIPKTVTDVSGVFARDFANDTIEPLVGVTDVYVEEGNEYFSSIDGVLYNKDQTRLIYCPPGKIGKITIPATVTEIGNYKEFTSGPYWLRSAFYGCSKITEIAVAESNPVYNSVDGVLYSEDMETLLYLPEGKTGTLTIPASVWYLQDEEDDASSADDSFDTRGNNSLTEIKVEEGNEYFSSIDGVLYGNDESELYVCPTKKTGKIELPETLSYVKEEAFENCKGITEVTFQKWAKLEYGAFKGCIGLTEIKVPDYIGESIESSVFQGCSNLETVVAPKVTRVYSSAFKDCVKLKNITLSENLKLVSDEAFQNCSSLESFSFSETMILWGLGDGAFDGCTSLKEIEIPACVEQIPDYAFRNCTALEKVTIAEGIKEVRRGAFQNCVSLKKVSIPSSGNFLMSAFCGCSGLQEVMIKSENMNMYYLGSQFHGCDNNLLLIVLEGSSAEDFAKSWGYKYRYIQPEDFEESSSGSGETEGGSEETGGGNEETGIKPDTTPNTNETISNEPQKKKNCKIKLSKNEYVYNGKTKTPSVVVTDEDGKQLQKDKDYTVKYPKSRNKVGIYTVAVTLTGNYSGTLKTTYKIIPKAVSGKISLLSQKRGFTVKWKKQKIQTDGYQIQYSTSKKFAKKQTDIVTIKKNTVTTKTILKLKSKKKYYVRIRAYSNVKVNGKTQKLYSDWTSAKPIITK